MFHSLNINIPVTDQGTLPVKLGIKLRVLALAVIVNLSLFIDLGPERLDESYVSIDSRLVVLVHPPLFFIQTAEILFQVHQLVLQLLVVALSLAQICCFFHKLGNHAFFLGRCPSAITSGPVRHLMTHGYSALFCGLIDLSNVVCCGGLLWLVHLLGVNIGVGAAFGAVGAKRARVTHMIGWHCTFLHFLSVMNVLNYYWSSICSPFLILES